MKFALRCLECGLAHWAKCTYRELRGVLGLLQKVSWCTKCGHKVHLFQQHDFLCIIFKSVANTYSKEQRLLIDQDR